VPQITLQVEYKAWYSCKLRFSTRLLCCRLPCYTANFRDDRSVILLAQPFGYGSKGHIKITLKRLSLYRRHDQADQDFSLKNLGIVLSDTESQGKLETYLRSGKCPLQDAELRIFNFDTKEIQNVLTGEKDAAQLDVGIQHGGLASLFFINCEAGMPASFAVKVEQYNLVGDPERKDYLAIGETELDVMYWVSVPQSTLLPVPQTSPMFKQQCSKCCSCKHSSNYSSVTCSF
jgi:hypothetical protein